MFPNRLEHVQRNLGPHFSGWATVLSFCVDSIRHRDQLLSLKYSTIEACFSVPMLNLTLPVFPFVLAFAVTGLKWQAGAVGLIASLPHICNFLQPLLLTVLSRRLSIFSLLVLTFLMGGIPWSLAFLLPFAGEWRDPLFVGVLLVSTLGSSVASVAWSTAISEVVPQRLAGRYFAKRNLIFGIWTLLAVWTAGLVAEWFGNTLLVFAIIFSVAGSWRIIATLFLMRMKWPPNVRQRQERGVSLTDFKRVFADRNYLWLCLFVGFWGMLLNSAVPFYTVFLVDNLSFGTDHVITLTTLASLGGLLTLKGWGRLSERFGNRPVMQIAALAWASTALLAWAFARPGWTWHLHLTYMIVGAATAGFQLMQFNLMVRLAPGERRPAYVAVFIAFTSALTALGPLTGGFLLRHIPGQVGVIFGLPILSFHLLFAAAAVGNILSIYFLRRVREPAEGAVEDVWREMRSMRTFNPMLSVLSAGELLLTPRGLFALGRRSLRSVRQQVKALESVGEEIVSGSKEVIKGPLLRRK